MHAIDFSLCGPEVTTICVRSFWIRTTLEESWLPWIPMYGAIVDVKTLRLLERPQVDALDFPRIGRKSEIYLE